MNISSLYKELNAKKDLLQNFSTTKEDIDKRLIVYITLLLAAFAGFFALETEAHRAMFYLLLISGATLLISKQTISELYYSSPYLITALVLFLIYNSLSFFWSTTTDGQGLLDSLRFPVFILLFILSFAAAYKKWPASIPLLEAVFIGVSAIVAIYFLLNYIAENPALSELGKRRLEGLGLSSNSNILARLNAFAVLVVLFGVLSTNASARKGATCLKLAFATLYISVILLTGSRGTLLALAGVLLFVSFVNKRILEIFIFSFLFISGVIFFIAYPDALKNFINRGDSLRFEIWEQAWTYIKEAPVFGYGAATEFGFTIKERPNLTQTSTHNIFLGTLLYGGVTGLLLLLWVSALAVSISFKIGRKRGIWLPFSLLLFGAIATQFSGHTLFLNFNDEWWYSWIPLAYILALLSRDKGESKEA